MTIIIRQPWTRQPQRSVQVNRLNPLTNGLSHLYSPSVGVNSVTGALVKASGAIDKLLRSDAVYTSTVNQYFSGLSLAQANAVAPWTIAVLMRITSSSSGADAYQVCLSEGAGTNSGSTDRGLQFSWAAGTFSAVGSLYDVGAKKVTHNVGITPGSGSVAFTCVVSASGGKLRIFLNGVPGSSETTISANGYNGFGSAPYFNIATGGTSGYEYGLIARHEGVAWLEKEARQFHSNPWQLFAPRRIIIPTSTAAPTAPTLSALSAINITATTVQPRMTYTF